MNETLGQWTVASEIGGAAIGAVAAFAAAYALYLITSQRERRDHLGGLIAGLLFELRDNLRNIEAIAEPEPVRPGTVYTHYGARISTAVYRSTLANPLFLDLEDNTRELLQVAYRRLDYLRDMDAVLQSLSVRTDEVAQQRASTQGAVLYQSIALMQSELQPAIDALEAKLAGLAG